MNKYKVEFVQVEKFIVDVLAENEEKAREKALQEWENGNYQETGDLQIDIDMVYDVTNTDDPFDPSEVLCSWCGFKLTKSTDQCSNCGKHDGTSENNE